MAVGGPAAAAARPPGAAAFQGERPGATTSARGDAAAVDRRSMLSAEIMGAIYRELLRSWRAGAIPSAAPPEPLDAPQALGGVADRGRTLLS